MEVKFNELSNVEQCLVFLDSGVLRKEVLEEMVCRIDESIEYQFENMVEQFSFFKYGHMVEPSIQLKRTDFDSIYRFATSLKDSNSVYNFLDETLEGQLIYLLELLEAEEVNDIKYSLDKVEPTLKKVIEGLITYLDKAYSKVGNERELVKYFFEVYIKNVDDMENCFYNEEEEALYRYTKKLLK